MSDGKELRPGFVRDLFRLDGKVALVMGGRGALAEAIASTLADLGCEVALASRHERECAEIATRIATRFERRAVGLHCDIAREEDIERTIAEVSSALGEIGILVNNAGASWWGLPQEIPLAGWRK